MLYEVITTDSKVKSYPHKNIKVQRIVAIILLTLVLSVKAQNVSRIHQTLEMPQWSSQPIVLSNEIKGGIV